MSPKFTNSLEKFIRTRLLWKCFCTFQFCYSFYRIYELVIFCCNPSIFSLLRHCTIIQILLCLRNFATFKKISYNNKGRLYKVILLNTFQSPLRILLYMSEPQKHNKMSNKLPKVIFASFSCILHLNTRKGD